MLLYVRWIQCYSDVVNFNRKLNRALIPEVGPFQSITKVQKILKVCFFFFFSLPLKLNELAVMWVNRPAQICRSNLCHAGSCTLKGNNEILCLLRSLRPERLKRSSADDFQHARHAVYDCVWTDQQHVYRTFIITSLSLWNGGSLVWTPKLLGEV